MIKSRGRLPRIALLTAGLVMVTGALTACTSQSTSTAQCAYVVGDGQGDRDRMIKSIAYPNQKTEDLTEKVAQFVPCGPRNFIVNDGTVLNANKKQVGDRFTPSQAWSRDLPPTKPRKQLDVWTSTYWTLNQDGKVMRDFYTLCYKYTCYTDDATKAGDANFSTPGWNGMLGETFGASVDQAAIQVLGANFDSDLDKHPELWPQLGDLMSAEFVKQVRSTTGYSSDLFCGSGNSGWKDASKPGEGQFTCAAVRIKVDKVRPSNPQDIQADAQAAALAQRVTNAKQLYGDQWAYWLGVQDAIDKCRNNKETTCVINIGGTSLSVPVAANK